MNAPAPLLRDTRLTGDEVLIVVPTLNEEAAIEPCLRSRSREGQRGQRRQQNSQKRAGAALQGRK